MNGEGAVADEQSLEDDRGENLRSGIGPDPRLIDKVYEEWRPSQLPDPKEVPITSLIPGLVEIVKAEGPMPAHRACQLFVKAAGRQRVGKECKKILYAGLRRAIYRGLLEAKPEEKDSGFAMQVIRAAGSPPVVVRPRGPRRFNEIPASEIAVVMTRLESSAAEISASDLCRAVLSFYDTKRMTVQIEVRLRWIYEHRDQLTLTSRASVEG